MPLQYFITAIQKQNKIYFLFQLVDGDDDIIFT